MWCVNKKIIELSRLNILFYLILILFVTSSCKGQIQDDKELIQNFIDNVLNQDSMDFEKFYAYVPIHKTLKKNEDFKKLMNYTITVNKELNQIEPGEYDIISYNEIDKYPKVKKSKSYEKLVYTKKENVYYATKSDESQNAYLFILEDGEIVSFFPYIHIGVDPVRPFMLNRRGNKEYLKTIIQYIGL